MNRLAKNSIAAGLTTLLVTTGLSFAANGADGDKFTAHAEAQFISAGDEALGGLLETISDQIEGVEVTCEPATAATDCTETQENDELIALPLAGPTGISIGAANNFASGDSGEGSAQAASGAVSDSGTINTDANSGFPGDLTIDLPAGQLSPIADAVANPELSLGAIGSSAKVTGTDGAPGYDYSVADAALNLEIPALATIFDAIEEATGEGIPATGSVSLESVCDAIGDSAEDALDDLCGALGDLIPVTVTFPSLDEILSSFEDNTDDGIVIDLAAGTVVVDLDRVLGKEINQANFPASPTGTDLLPLVTEQIDVAVTQLVASIASPTDGIIQKIVDESAITITPPLAEPIVLSADQANVLVTPLLEALSTGLSTLTGQLAEATPDLSDGLAQLLQLKVGTTGLADDTLVGDDKGAGATNSVTAVRVQLLEAAEAADLRLATSVVGPVANVDVNNDDDNANADGTNADGTNADGTNADGTNADANADANADGTPAASIADADSAADADVAASLPNAGAPNLLPFFLLGIALLAFGLAVLLNERRRLGLPSSDDIA